VGELLPDKCPVCRGVLLTGKRPGLEALLPAAIRCVREYPVLGEPLKRPESPSLLLGTRRLLALCDSVDAGLIAWLDLDAEARKTDYNARFQTFSMVWESFWRGLDGAGERVVLMQTRRPGSAWQSTLWSGWGNFWQGELEERKNLDLPPYGLLVQIDLPPAEDREAFARTLEDAGLAVMDSGETSSLRVALRSIEPLRTALAPRFEIRHSRRGFPVATVFAE
jgi:primosomal protein N' (replication factor Y)